MASPLCVETSSQWEGLH